MKTLETFFGWKGIWLQNGADMIIHCLREAEALLKQIDIFRIVIHTSVVFHTAFHQHNLSHQNVAKLFVKYPIASNRIDRFYLR